MINPVSNPIALRSLQGMQNASKQFEAAAAKIAQASDNFDVVDLSSEMVAMINARDNFMANVEAAKSGDQLQRTLLNLIG